jgi:galacturonokinase
MPDLQSIKRLVDQVARHYGVDRTTVRAIFAPYRVCPLGAHIDHQSGPVTAMALDRGVLLAYAPLATPEARMRSFDYPGEVRFPFARVPDVRPGDWGNYVRGAVRALQQHHRLDTGLVGVTQGSVAEGGLSSSAAVGVAYLLALEDVNRLRIAPEENILLDQAIENTYLGLRNGVLDQSAILLSRRGHLTRIDCATLQYELVPPAATLSPPAILIACSGLRQALISTDYNRRVAECAEAARTLLEAAGHAGDPPLLGLVSDDEYTTYRDRLSGPPARRATHFFSERERVGHGVDAWRRGDLREFGRLITASGDSSIRNYQCGAPPLVDLYQLLVEADGVYGARFSGAGFRGCCLALVDPQQAAAVAADVAAAYGRRYPDLASQAQMMLCQSDDGARRVSS